MMMILPGKKLPLSTQKNLDLILSLKISIVTGVFQREENLSDIANHVKSESAAVKRLWTIVLPVTSNPVKN
jgi:hypothetical protein